MTRIRLCKRKSPVLPVDTSSFRYFLPRMTPRFAPFAALKGVSSLRRRAGHAAAGRRLERRNSIRRGCRVNRGHRLRRAGSRYPSARAASLFKFPRLFDPPGERCTASRARKGWPRSAAIRGPTRSCSILCDSRPLCPQTRRLLAAEPRVVGSDFDSPRRVRRARRSPSTRVLEQGQTSARLSERLCGITTRLMSNYPSSRPTLRVLSSPHPRRPATRRAMTAGRYRLYPRQLPLHT